MSRLADSREAIRERSASKSEVDVEDDDLTSCSSDSRVERAFSVEDALSASHGQESRQVPHTEFLNLGP